MAQRTEIEEESVGARLARLEGAVSQMDKRISELREDLNRRIDEFRTEVNRRISEFRTEVREQLEEFGRRLDRVEGEIREVRNRFWWIIGILITMWVTIIIATLFGR